MIEILEGDCIERLRGMPDQSVNTCVTSPPYFGLRDYGHEGQIGLEPTPEEYVRRMVDVFREVRRVLRDDGTLWLNLGDSYARQAGDDSTKATDTGFGEGRGTGRTGKSHLLFKTGNNRPPEGLKPKDLIGIPWRVAFALQSDGWYLRQDIIWNKPNPMPESVRDRCTKAHEYIFLMAKSERYYFDSDAIEEPAIHAGKIVTNNNGKNGKMGDFGATRGGFLKDGGVLVKDTRNKRSVWTVTTKPYKGAHFATFPPNLIEPCILAGCPQDGTVLDPFGGSGTTGVVAKKHGRKAVLIELNPTYAEMARVRIAETQAQQGLL